MADAPEGWEAGPAPDATLKAVAQRESGNRNLPASANVNYNVSGPRHSEASSEYQFEPGTWAEATKATPEPHSHPLLGRADIGYVAST